MAAEETPKKAERIEVVGSNIKRINKEGPTSVTVFKRADIERTGAQSISELVQTLSSNVSSTNETAGSSGFAAGAAGISLRGLGEQNTLVLLNGRRVANYGLALSGTINFVDINSLPMSAVEQVQVLKDGASAIYGSDAIAGVVNIITRKSYKGLEAKLNYGQTTKGDGQQQNYNLTAGTGDLDEDKYNFLFSIDVQRTDRIASRDRSFSASADKRELGGRDLRSPTGAPGSYNLNDGRGWQPMSSCPAGNVQPAGKDRYCSYDFMPVLDNTPPTSRQNLFALLNVDLNDQLRWFTEMGYSQNEALSISAPTPISGANYAIEANNPNNPFQRKASIRWRSIEAGNRETTTKTRASRLLTGLKGTLFNVDYDTAIGVTKSNSERIGKNYLHKDLLAAALQDGRLNPFGNNDAATWDTVKATTTETGNSVIKFADLKLSSSDIIALPGGGLGLAGGAEYRRETTYNARDAVSAAGKIEGSGGAGSDGERTTKSVYIEANLPVHQMLELQTAVRRDSYSDSGSKTSRKYAFRFQPLKSVMFRGSVSEAFRAPSMSQLYLGTQIGYQRVVDTPRCDATGSCAEIQIESRTSGNPKLKPETSRNYSLGFMVEPLQSLSIGVDFWKISQKNVVGSVEEQYVLDHAAQYPDLIVRRPGAAPGDPGEIDYVRTPFLNISSSLLKGVDIDVRYRFKVDGVGTFTIQDSATYKHKHESAKLADDPMLETVGLYGDPKWHNNMSISLDAGAFGGTLGWNYVGRFLDEGDRDRVTNDTRQIASFSTFDLQGTYSGLKNTKFTLGIKNMFDRQPPFITYGNDANYGFNRSAHDGRGRYVYGTVNYKFK
ncbi:TonB-dependent receptor [Chitinivorax sp. B]|uniref:TonB-dependent receptor n=1 Tax=Chitinivorax sp. B TaxID=2502235 RepID=UPI001484CBDA|nr:TonB-dependent receptor [Chitinivorax sp. B]